MKALCKAFLVASFLLFPSPAIAQDEAEQEAPALGQQTTEATKPLPTGRLLLLSGTMFGGVGGYDRKSASYESVEHADLPIPRGQEVAVLYRALDHFGMGVSGAFYDWDSSERRTLGYSSYRFDLGVRAQAWLHKRKARPSRAFERTFQPYAYVPLGLTFPITVAPDRLAFEESYSNERGWYGGLGIGFSVISRRVGAFLDLLYTRHTSRHTVLYEPFDGSPSISERITYTYGQLGFLAGIAFALGPRQ